MHKIVARYKEGERDFSGMDLRQVYLRDANLSGAYLSGANFYDADLRGVDWRDANLSDANLENSDLEGANLMGADLEGANLYSADLRDANLSGADLRGASLIGALGISLFYGVGNGKRYGFVYRYDGKYRVQLGCWNGTEEETIDRIMDNYSAGIMRDAYIAMVKAAVLVVKSHYQ